MYPLEDKGVNILYDNPSNHETLTTHASFPDPSANIAAHINRIFGQTLQQRVHYLLDVLLDAADDALRLTDFGQTDHGVAPSFCPLLSGLRNFGARD